MSANQADLLEQAAQGQQNPLSPLADRMRPDSLQNFFGQTHLLGEGKPLTLAIKGEAPFYDFLGAARGW